MNDTTPAVLKREERRTRMLKLAKSYSLAQIGQMEEVPISRARVSQIIGPTPRQRNSNRLLNVYRFIESYVAEYGFSPTIIEIANNFPRIDGSKRSSSVIHFWLDQMRELDMLAPRRERTARSIVLKPLNKRKPAIAEMLKIEQENSNGR